MTPSDDKCLQAVDFVSWALWQKYEKGDETYSDIISGKIVKEYVMYQWLQSDERNTIFTQEHINGQHSR